VNATAGLDPVVTVQYGEPESVVLSDPLTLASSEYSYDVKSCADCNCENSNSKRCKSENGDKLDLGMAVGVADCSAFIAQQTAALQALVEQMSQLLQIPASQIHVVSVEVCGELINVGSRRRRLREASGTRRSLKAKSFKSKRRRTQVAITGRGRLLQDAGSSVDVNLEISLPVNSASSAATSVVNTIDAGLGDALANSNGAVFSGGAGVADAIITEGFIPVPRVMRTYSVGSGGSSSGGAPSGPNLNAPGPSVES
jgi:hypothetical protein